MKKILNAFLAFMLVPLCCFAQPDKMKVHVINVGQGLSTLVEFPCGAILVDTGGEKNVEFDGTQMLLRYLDEFFARRTDLSRTLDLLLITHPHSDHTRGIRDVVENFAVRNVVTNGQEYGSGSAQQKFLHAFVDGTEASPDPDDDIGYFEGMLDEIGNHGTTNAIVDPLNCSGVDPVITLLWGRMSAKPASWSQHAFDNNNNHSVVSRIDFGESSVLITGDLEDVAIAELVRKYRTSNMLDTDVYIVGHHGSKNGSSADLLRAVTPEVAVLACGDPERQIAWTAWKYGHPNKGIVRMLSDHCTRDRISRDVLVGNGATRFEFYTISKAIYSTGWDGHIALEAGVDGNWYNPDEIVPHLVNVNTASLEELMTLPHIGPVRATAIFDYRTTHGAFTTINDLDDVPGIGPATIVRIRSRITI